LTVRSPSLSPPQQPSLPLSNPSNMKISVE
jgi:hypothetical protein